MKPEPTAALNPAMTSKELCQYLHIHPSTISRLVRKGEIPAFKVGSDYRFNREQIGKWIAEKERSPRSFKVRHHT
ncbi:MAG: helix-turn-helix domain-containing protein [Candidatus Binataceae bacterium]